MNKYIVVFIIITSCFSVAAQQSDSLLLADYKVHDAHLEYERKVVFGFDNTKSPLGRYNPVSLVFSSLMFTYQKWLSPQISATCLFEPSCSAYSKQLIKRYGIITGTFATADRLMRCDRISATSIKPTFIDPVDYKHHENVERYKLCK
jgi:putative membrane protein insertion efficiency factor